MGVTAAVAEVVRMTAARIINNATAPIITSGTQGRKNASARRVSNTPATARAMPAVTEMPATGSLESANARRDTPGMRRRGLAFVQGRIGAR